MKSECVKCGYRSKTNKSKFGKELCEFCYAFAPEDEESFNQYLEEKTNWRDLQTYRKQGKLAGKVQKKGMIKKASEGFVMSRAPFGYDLKDKKLIPNENSRRVEEIFEIFLNTEISLNKLAKQNGFSVNGLKKILTNFTYLGKIKFNGNIHEGNHQALLSSTLFNHVQDKIERLGIKKIK